MHAMSLQYSPSLEYFAGFFDGEGYILMARRTTGTHRLRIGISCTHLPILEHYERNFGGAVYKTNVGTNKQMHRWLLSRISDCLQFLQQVQPFLIEKREQTDLGIQWLEYRQQFIMRGVLATYDMNFADDLAQKIKALKHVSF
jgi:hypothetical protein